VRECDFCNEFAGETRNAFAKRYGKSLPDRALMGTDRFRVVPSLGQIVEGHLLIAPVSHYRALADMSREDVNTLSDLCQMVRSTLQLVYGQCIFFEHGVRSALAGGCGIDHAHMHAVPVRAQGVLNVLTREYGGRPIYSLEEIKQELRPEQSYLYFEDYSAKRYVFPVDSLPSQYLRRLVAQSIGKSDWDWRACGHEPDLISAIQRLSPLFAVRAAARRG